MEVVVATVVAAMAIVEDTVADGVHQEVEVATALVTANVGMNGSHHLEMEVVEVMHPEDGALVVPLAGT